MIAVADTVEGAKHFPRMPELAIALGYRSCLFVPLLREGRAIGCDRHPARRHRRVRRPGDRARADLCRPGGDRDRERAPVQRDQGGARAADGDGRDPEGDQRARRPTCSRCSKPSSSARIAALRCRRPRWLMRCEATAARDGAGAGRSAAGEPSAAALPRRSSGQFVPSRVMLGEAMLRSTGLIRPSSCRRTCSACYDERRLPRVAGGADDARRRARSAASASRARPPARSRQGRSR